MLAERFLFAVGMAKINCWSNELLCRNCISPASAHLLRTLVACSLMKTWVGSNFLVRGGGGRACRALLCMYAMVAASVPGTSWFQVTV